MADEREFYGDYFGRVNVPNTESKGSVFADKKFMQALSYMLGWIATTEAWTPILADVDGRLLVSTSPTKSNEANHSMPVVTNDSSIVLIENASRKAIVIQNTGTVDVFLSMDGGDATVEDLLLPVDSTYTDDVYFGKITAITASTDGELRIVEFT